MSGLPFELMLALRYLRPKRTFVSIITLISILGVMLGVAVLVVVISVMSGFDHDLKERVFGFNAHIKVVPRGSTMRNYEEVSALVSGVPQVKGVAPFILGQVLVETQPEFGQKLRFAPVVRGVDPRLERSVSTLPDRVTIGDFDFSDHGLVIGSVLAENLEVTLGDRLAIHSYENLEKMSESLREGEERAILPDDFEIRGIFDAGYYEFNASFILASIEDAQSLCGLEEEDSVHGLTVAVDDPLNAQSVAEALSATLGPDFKVTTWMEDSPMMLAVMVEKNMQTFILFFIVLVAAFGITCTLITFIMMKTREIGVMKALGATNRQVLWVFLSQSLVVSFFGIAAGLGLGLLAVTYRNEFLDFMRQSTGMQLFPAEIYGFGQLPALIVPGDIVVISGGSLIICLLAAAFPAWHASRLDPVEALRHE